MSARVPSTFVHVISVAGATERRAEFSEQARGARSAWAFVDAARDAPSNLPYVAEAAERRFGRVLAPNEVGCFASHFAAWQGLLASTHDQLIVLEDDVLVDWRALDRIAEVDFAALGLHLLRLYATHPFRHETAIVRFLGPHQHLVRARGMFLGCQGYVLTRHAAERLTVCARAIHMPVDWFMGRYWEFGFPNYCLFPFPIIERCVASNIGDRSEAPPISRTAWLARQYHRATDRVARELADRVRFARNPFEALPDAGPSFVERTGHVVVR
jgi:glycosyl transferase family 25